jgi:hypothetical protein
MNAWHVGTCEVWSGTGTTAVLAARIPRPEFIAPVELAAEMEDAVELCRERAAAARKEADQAKSEMGLRQAVRSDMRLRAKVCAAARPLFNSCCVTLPDNNMWTWRRSRQVWRSLQISTVTVMGELHPWKM